MLELFWTFFKIGALSFGGGYGMISVVREAVLGKGWLTEEAFLSLIAVSESTPGPLAVNMATFIGASQGGFRGALAATCGVVLPAFCIILLIAAVLKNLLRYGAVQGFLQGVRPCVVGLILSTGLTMALSVLFSLSTLSDLEAGVPSDWRRLVIFAALPLCSLLYKKKKGKRLSPIALILLSAGLGVVFYGI